jgi:hypothetical protein
MSTGADSLFSSLLQASHPSPIKESAKVKVQAGPWAFENQNQRHRRRRRAKRLGWL